MTERSCSSIVDLHHVEVLCRGAASSANKFCSTFGFRAFAQKSEHVAVRSERTVFLFRERHSLYPVDTVASLCFIVEDVTEAFERAVRAGGEPLVAPTNIEDRFGRVQVAEIRTPFGNSALKFVNTTDYNGVFLPEYEDVACCCETARTGETCQEQRSLECSRNELTYGCDHVTYACHRGMLDECVQWFSTCLGFQRLSINQAEEAERGFIVDSAAGSVGMRLKAMDYFRCRESQLVLAPDQRNAPPTTSTMTSSTSNSSSSSSSSSDRHLGVKLVFAEPLTDGANQVQLFLNDHGGPGIQHIGLTSRDIFSTIETMRQAHAQFIFIPPDFYSQCHDLVTQSCVSLPGDTLSKLEHSNILLDIEENVLGESRYLMQAFTKPLFSESTFFLEVIQRVGATGFGAGNITALWRALQQHFARQQQQHTITTAATTATAKATTAASSTAASTLGASSVHTSSSPSVVNCDVT
eukprot:scpid51399/ scgid3599/ 4-hydroxyphenylpyruvate dioxygenase-like protein; Glyoxalase domain-containing protein 1